MFHSALRRRVLAFATLASIGLSGCGGPAPRTAGSPTPVTSVDQALATSVPDAVRSDGKLVVGTDTTYEPAEFLDPDGNLVGFDVDLVEAVADKLGLAAEFQSAPFGEIPPGLRAGGKYEVGVSSFTINPGRKGQSLMVSYFQAGTQWATKAGNPAGVKLDGLCGRKVAVQRDTMQVADVTARSKKCTDARKPAITLNLYPDLPAATSAVTSGSDDAIVAESPRCGYAVKRSDGRLELLGEVYGSALYGLMVGKDQPALAAALREALKALIAEGTYQKVLERWGVQGGAIPEPKINP